jgi:hypothetical protein
MSNRPTGFPLGKPIRIAEEHSGPSVYDTPFDSVAEACATIAEGVRGLGLTVNIIESGKVVQYWWESGKTDADLVQKVTGSGSGGGTGSGYKTLTVGSMADLDAETITESIYLVKGAIEGMLIKVGDSAVVHQYNQSQYNNSQYQ